MQWNIEKIVVALRSKSAGLYGGAAYLSQSKHSYKWVVKVLAYAYKVE